NYALVIPEIKRNEILRLCHDDPLAGHTGIDRTYYRIRSRAYWPKLFQDVEKYVQSCNDCQTRKRPIRIPPGLCEPIVPNEPFMMVGIDFEGPLPITDNGNKYIIVLTDYATRYAETKATRTSTAAEVSEFLAVNVICRHGAPRQLLSDRGTAFLAEVVEKLLLCVGTEHLRTTAYHPQTNGLTERLNGKIIESMSMYVASNLRNWDKILPFITYAYNTSRQESTKYTPFELVYAREARLPMDNLNLRSTIGFTDGDSYGDAVMKFAAETRKQAVQNLTVAQQKMKKRYDKKHKPVSYDEGQYVMVKFPTNHKLKHPWFGPFIVLRQVGCQVYEVASTKPRARVFPVNVQKMKPYNEREAESIRKKNYLQRQEQRKAASKPNDNAPGNDETHFDSETDINSEAEENAPPEPHTTRVGRIVRKPQRYLNMIGIVLLLILTSSVSVSAVSPLYNQSFLASAGSHGIQVNKWGVAHVFDGFWSQIIEIEIPPQASMEVNSMRNLFGCELTTKELCFQVLEFMKNMQGVVKNYYGHFNRKLSNLVKDEPTTAWLNTEDFSTFRKRRSKKHNNQSMRKKRNIKSIIPLFGDALKVLFGTATTEDVDHVKHRYKELKGLIAATHKETAVIKASLIGLTEMIDKRDEKLVKGMKVIADHVLNVEEQIGMLKGEFADEKNRTREYRTAQEYVSRIIVSGLFQLYNLTLMAFSIDDIEEYFVQMRAGKLPVTLVPWDKLKPILDNIQQIIAPLYRLGINEEEWQLYYILPLVKFSLIPNGLMLRLTIPLRTINLPTKYRILKPVASPVPCVEKLCTWFDRIHANDSFVTLMLKDRGWLSNDEMEELNGEVDIATFTCITIGDEKVCYVFDPSLVQRVGLCSLAIWNWNPKSVLRECQFELSLRELYQPIKLTEDSWVVHKSAVPEYDVICLGKGSKSHHPTNWAEVAIVETGCYLKSKDYTLYGPLKYRDNRLDLVRGSAPVFIFDTQYISNDYQRKPIISQPKEESKEIPKLEKLNLTQFENSIQLDQRFSTVVTDKLWRATLGVSERMRLMGQMEQKRQHKSKSIIVLSGASKIAFLVMFLWCSVLMLRRGYWILWFGPVYEIANAIDPFEVLDDNDINYWTTVSEDPYEEVFTIVLLLLTCVIVFVMWKYNYGRVVRIESHLGTYDPDSSLNVNLVYNKETFIVIFLAFQYGSFLNGLLVEITVKMQTTCLDSNTFLGTLNLIGNRKKAIIVQDIYGRYVLKLSSPIRIECVFPGYNVMREENISINV
ncbi:gag-pol fusion protein-like protein, partial [Leptotrombidium deliense]